LRGNIAKADAPVVAQLRRAGAILLGKTVTTEFACFDPPPTRNPWNLAHTPGGSSSGSAAAVAAGMCLAALGSQTGGSITRPASFCGVCGLKPTFGRLSVDGVYPIAFHLDHPGPLAPTVADLAILWSVLGDEEVPAPAGGETQPPRLALLGGFFAESADAAVRAATRDAVERLKAAGASIAEVPLPEEFGEVHSVHRRIMAVEAAEHHRERYLAHRDQYGASISALIEEGFSVAAVDYAAALKQQSYVRAAVIELLRRFDALVTPATVTAAPASLETTGDPAFNSPWSLAGLPTVSFPCGLSPNGMPCSLQLTGAWRVERDLLKAAAWCEARLGFSESPSFATSGIRSA
jgi:aspartyl-tRNA(Asn)/glutamyl-tRNA(Gln) amidotransferase subunit A